MTRAALALTAAVAALWAALYLALRHHAPALAILWTATMLASFAGWGSLVSGWVAPGRRIDWGLRMGWGMALFVLTGGFLCGLHLTARPLPAVHVLLGVAVLFVTEARQRAWYGWRHELRRAAVWKAEPLLAALVAVAFVLAGLTCLGYLGYHAFQPSDDAPFYFTLPEKLVQTGSMFEPYAARRASSFGGQVYLHAAFISVGSIYYLHVVDGGISMFVAVALLVGEVTRRGLKAALFAPLGMAALVLFTLLSVRVNTASLMSGVAAILTLDRTMLVPLQPGAERRWPLEPKRVAVLSGVLLVCILLRTSNAAFVLPYVGLVVLSDWFDTGRPWSRDALRSLALTTALFAGVTALLLVPWSILMRESTGALFFPFGKNNITPGWTFLTHPDNFLAEFGMHFFWGRPVVLWLPFVLAGLLPVAASPRKDVIAFTLAALIAFLVQTWQSAAFGPRNTARYYFAYVAASAIVVALSFGQRRSPGASSDRNLRRIELARDALVVIGVAVHFVLGVRDANGQALRLRHGIATGLRESGERSFQAATETYRELQASMEPGARIVTAVYEPWRFDYKRNDLLILDFLGGMGPKPGWPFEKGPEALADYLVANGVRYLVWIDFGVQHEFYNKEHWQENLTLKGHYLEGEAVIQLDAEDAIEKLTALRHIVFKSHKMTVVDLTQVEIP
jgi:hypothetical protein